MRTDASRSALPVSLLLLGAGLAPGAPLVLTEGTNISADVAPDGRLAFDLLGSIWLLPTGGGEAEVLTENLLPARRPRWSPQGDRILYQTESTSGNALWLLDVDSREAKKTGDGRYLNQHGSWHPDGDRIVFSSVRGDSGLDLWEHDLPSGLSWRISDHQGDESDAAWSANGRHLAYVRVHDGKWTLVLRRFGEAERELVTSPVPLSSLSWRPDGSLLTFLQPVQGKLTLQMLILSDPPLQRVVASGEDFFLSPVSWLDRQRYFYTADGLIKSRGFEARRAKAVNFRASVGEPASRPRRTGAQRELPIVDPPDSLIVIRAARLFDGISRQYRENVDVVIGGPRITAVESHRPHDNALLLDLGEVTILPGFIDGYSSIPDVAPSRAGMQLLSYGVTTIVTDVHPDGVDPDLWESESNPGPRLLFADNSAASQPANAEPVFMIVPSGLKSGNASTERIRQWQDRGLPLLADNWRVGLSIGANLLLGAHTMPTSPSGRQYDDVRLAMGSGPMTLVSGLADAGTPGISQLFRSRQAVELGQSATVPRRYSTLPQFGNQSSAVVLGSKPSGLPPGLALHAELRALAAAGLPGDRVLRAAGADAATILGLGDQVGRVSPGSLADLVLVSGDPLTNVADALNVVAVVRNGRFYSTASLLERATDTQSVE